MNWNWQLSDWPKFTYDRTLIDQKERLFFLTSGMSLAFLENIGSLERNQFIIEILSMEGIESSKIEGELLERASLQSSIKKHFGLDSEVKQETKKEKGMAELLCNVYETFEKPLTHEMLWEWHAILFRDNEEKYPAHEEPMQIVSGRLDSRRVFFEAPPSKKVFDEMTLFINWFNFPNPAESVLGRAAITHVYFETIHPFEDGNGRIGRVLSEKVLSQGVGKPTLIAISKFIEKQKKTYYEEIGGCNRSLEASSWVSFFADVVLQAQEDSIQFLHFLIEKSKLFTELSGLINERQEKVLLRMFEEGLNGFKGGLSAENYISITKASRATTTRNLAELVQKGALIRTGELRYTRYFLNLKSNA